MVAPAPDWTHASSDASHEESPAFRLASALRSLVARDDEPPPVWRSGAFADGVEAIRASLAKARTLPAIDRAANVVLDGAPGSGWPFALVAQRLARDPAAVAIAMRWLEVDACVVLPTWADVIRRRALDPVGRPAVADAELWFG